MECTHLLDNVKVDDLYVEDTTITRNFNCSECSVSDQNWLCLQCGAVNCGRYINGHAKQHADTLDHHLCMSCDVYSVYCYKCDDYVSNDLKQQTIHKIRQSIMQIRKKEEGNHTENIEDIQDGSEGETSLVSSTSALDKPPSPSSGEESRTDNTATSSCDLPSTITHTNTDTSENEPSKSIKNPDEPVRSLRPRKRTISDENIATEISLKLRSKEKKASRYNGKSQREKRIVGLKNLGNTCFMNAVLQSLNNIQEFSCYLSQLPSLEVKPNGRKVYHSRSYTRQEMHDVVMAEELRKVLINLNSGCGSKGGISPECLFLVIWKVVPRFRGYQQQDAHEFLRYMLDRLHTELQQLWPEREALGRPPSSIVTAVFGGTLQSEVRCLACGARSHKLDPFLDLSLELPERPAALHDCLASFVQVEELADTERYFCSSCKCKQKSTKQFWIRRLPNVLCLHLKRFRWHNYFRTKVDTSIEFPMRALDMSRFVLAAGADARCHLYDLAAVIVHHGTGAGSGHYTAFAYNEEQWFHFNDHHVRVAEEAAVAGCKPYILFYIRRAGS